MAIAVLAALVEALYRVCEVRWKVRRNVLWKVRWRVLLDGIVEPRSHYRVCSGTPIPRTVCVQTGVAHLPRQALERVMALLSLRLRTCVRFTGSGLVTLRPADLCCPI